MKNSENIQSFLRPLFHALVGQHPYLWQFALHERLMRNDLPPQILAPTAAGKTMALAAFIAALADRTVMGKPGLSRRLVFVVNRRVLVDDVTRLAEAIHSVVYEDRIPGLKNALASLSATGNPLCIATLRGQFVDSGDWAVDPTTPAILLATPDMIGSRLLFRGYGLGRNRAPMQAGLLAFDTLLIHDEAHLAPAFSELMFDISRRAGRDAQALGVSGLQVMEMSATTRETGESAAAPLVCAPEGDPNLLKRMQAEKRLQITDVRSDKDWLERTNQLARLRATEGKAVAVFVTAPDLALKLANELRRAPRKGENLPPAIRSERTAVLTGTMRGFERELLLGTCAWQRISAARDGTDAEGAVLIATSAGEIGIDLDADVLICDEATLDRQIQRFGRCNRRGERIGEINLIRWPTKTVVQPASASKRTGRSSDLSARALRATELLRTLPPADEAALNASPLELTKLRSHPDYNTAIEPVAATRPLEETILDLFAATTYRLTELSAPDPAIWIHGLVSPDQEVNLVWRTLPDADLGRFLQVWPIHRREKARLPINGKVEKIVDEIAERQRKAGLGLPVWLDGSGQLSEVFSGKLRPGMTLLFDQRAGGLDNSGLPSAESTTVVTDVSPIQFELGRITSLDICHDGESGMWRTGDHSAATIPTLIAEVFPGEVCAWHAFEGNGVLTLWLRALNRECEDAGELPTTYPRLLEDHHVLAAKAARRICSTLGLPSKHAEVLERALFRHDAGKARRCWQIAVGNVNPTVILGKSGSARFDFNASAGYRHELGSLVGLEDSSPLVRHLIASHHGYARPSFPLSARIHEGCAEEARLAEFNYAQLSRTHGRWGLAYLEALTKCADVLAERAADQLANDPAFSPLPIALSYVACASEERAVLLRFEPQNPGEYLAAIGLLWLAQLENPSAALSWSDEGACYHGIDTEALTSSLESLSQATVQIDPRFSSGSDAEDTLGKYPPLVIHLRDQRIAINAWCNERFSDKSSWKLAAGRSDGLRTVRTLLGYCADSVPLGHPEEVLSFAMTNGLAAVKGRRDGSAKQDIPRLRYDARTSWNALDVGWSPYEENMSFARPWIEILALLGIQNALPPPARRDIQVGVWTDPRPLHLSLFAVRALTPDVIRKLTGQYAFSGQNLDAYFATPTHSTGDTACPRMLLI
ncbi:MAG: type I-U CRISPR-associated helicase/endonuclease Cas3 [Methyloversatilis sp.]|nr:type I-U CRISPR-associated helicase/endonuclease Cas3 [Methyloversatilis sp.]